MYICTSICYIICFKFSALATPPFGTVSRLNNTIELRYFNRIINDIKFQLILAGVFIINFADKKSERLTTFLSENFYLKTSKQVLSSGVTKHFILSQLARIKVREITSGVVKIL